MNVCTNAMWFWPGFEYMNGMSGIRYYITLELIFLQVSLYGLESQIALCRGTNCFSWFSGLPTYILPHFWFAFNPLPFSFNFYSDTSATLTTKSPPIKHRSHFSPISFTSPLCLPFSFYAVERVIKFLFSISSTTFVDMNEESAPISVCVWKNSCVRVCVCLSIFIVEEAWRISIWRIFLGGERAFTEMYKFTDGG